MQQMKEQVLALHPEATKLFEDLRFGSLDRINGGVTRDTYGPGEQFAHELVEQYARALGLEIEHDHLRNTYMTWPGRDRQAPAIVIGSHLDSVLAGGNYDGAAGVMAGLIAVQALQRAGLKLDCDVTVMGIRAEESIWFQVSYIGSRGALGTLAPSALKQARIDTGRSLEEHLREAGGDPAAVASSVAYLTKDKVRAFLELHIEQGGILENEKIQIGVVEGIVGISHWEVNVDGFANHAGTTPMNMRHDALLAAAKLIIAVNEVVNSYDGRQGSRQGV